MSDDVTTWLDTAQPDWQRVNMSSHALGQSYVAGDPRGDRIRVNYFKRPDGSLVGKVWFGPGTQGPPGHAHGGSMAALLDEAMGTAAWMAGYPVVAAKLTTNFRQMLPIGSRCLVEGRVEEARGRKIIVTGRLYRESDGRLFGDGEALFIRLADDVLASLGDGGAKLFSWAD